METTTTTTQAPQEAGKKKDALHLVVIGPPGAGKGTQCGRLAAQYNLEHISCGELMRQEKAMGTMLGQYLDDHWQLHKLSGIATDLVINTIKKAKANGKGFILDGSPRTPREAEMLAMAFTTNGIGLDGVIELTISEESATRRLLGRRVHQPSGRIYNLETNPPRNAGFDDVTGEELIQRADDLTGKGIEVRFRAYETYGATIPAFFTKPESGAPLFFQVDAGVDDPDAVYAELQRVVEPLSGAESKRAVCSFVRDDEDKADLDDRDSEKATSAAGMGGGQRVGPADSAIILQQVKLLVRSSKPASRFPGSHPVALTSKNIKQLLDDDYRVAPKIDGERRFLVLLDERLYLIDRRMRVELFPDIRFPARYNRTIFDGEVVSTAAAPSPDAGASEEKTAAEARQCYFVIFDVVCAEGEHVCHMPLHERLNLAKPIIDLVEAAPFELTFQDYHPLDRIHSVLRQQRQRASTGGGAHSDNQEQVEVVGSDDDDQGDSDNASFFPTDGLLFVPVYTPYRLGYCERMMKWKPPQENTIDFTLRSITANARRGDDRDPARRAGGLRKSGEGESESDDTSGENEVVFVKARDGAEADGAADADDAVDETRRYWQLFVLRDSNNYVFYDWIEFGNGDDSGADADDSGDTDENENERDGGGEASDDVVQRHGLSADNCIIECHWDPAKKIAHPPPASLLSVWGRGWSSGKGGWRFHRVRRDKSTPNAEWVVRNIEESIWDNLEEEDIAIFVEQNANTIRRLIEEGPRFVRSRSGSRGSGRLGSGGSGGSSRRGSNDSGGGSGANSRRGSGDSNSGGYGQQHQAYAYKRRERGDDREERWERGNSNIRDRTERSYSNNYNGYNNNYNSSRVRSASVPNEGSADDASQKGEGAHGGRFHHNQHHHQQSNASKRGGGRGYGAGGNGEEERQRAWGGPRSGGGGNGEESGRWTERGTSHNKRGGGRGERESFSSAGSSSTAKQQQQQQQKKKTNQGGGNGNGAADESKKGGNADGWSVVGRRK